MVINVKSDQKNQSLHEQAQGSAAPWQDSIGDDLVIFICPLRSM